MSKNNIIKQMNQMERKEKNGKKVKGGFLNPSQYYHGKPKSKSQLRYENADKDEY